MTEIIIYLSIFNIIFILGIVIWLVYSDKVKIIRTEKVRKIIIVDFAVVKLYHVFICICT